MFAESGSLRVPGDAQRCKRLSGICTSAHSSRDGLPVKSLCLQVAPASASATAEHVTILIPLIEAFDAQYRHVFKTLKAVVNQATTAAETKEEKTVALMRSLPGIGVIISTT